MVQSKLLLKFPEIEHFFLNAKESQSELFREMVQKARFCSQDHSEKIAIVKFQKGYLGVDGLISKSKSFISIRTADCIPIFLFDNVNKTVASLHAGWRGLSKGIASKAIK